jgi:hypothetical protein
MPVHDWTRVFDGAFHDFHHAWIAELRRSLNDGVLPPDYYAMAEQVARPTAPDVLTLQTANGLDEGWLGEPVAGATAVATAPPRVCQSDIIEEEIYARRQRSVVIRHTSDDRIIAVLDVLSAVSRTGMVCLGAAGDDLSSRLAGRAAPIPRRPRGANTRPLIRADRFSAEV